MTLLRYFFSLIFMLACVNNAQPMDMKKIKKKHTLEIESRSTQENREFLEKQILTGKPHQDIQNLRYLLTGLMVQDQLFTAAGKVYKESLVLQEKNNCVNKFSFAQEKLVSVLDVGGEIISQFNFSIKTKEGMKAILQHGKHIRHLCDKSCNVYDIVESLQKRHEKSSESYSYGGFLLARYECQIQTAKYQEVLKGADNMYKTKIEEHKSSYLNLIRLGSLYNEIVKNSVNDSRSYFEFCIAHQKPQLAKLCHLARSVSDHTSYEDDFKLFDPFQEELRNLYKLGVEKLNQIKQSKKQTRETIKYFATLEKEPKPFLLSLDPKAVEHWIPNTIITLHKPSNTKKKNIKKPQQGTLALSALSNNQVNKQEENPTKLSLNSPQVSNEFVDVQKFVIQDLVISKDGSFVEKHDKDELVIMYPMVKTKITLYPINSEACPVLLDLENLVCTSNICQWNDNPAEALSLQGYSNKEHRYYTPLKKEQNRMIYIHALPQEMKKHAKKYAQQTSCDSRLHKGQKDIQVTFCGELTYPSGKTKTGLFIYLIDGKTNKLYHHMFEESSYEKTFKKYMEQGNFNNAFDKVFFPELKDIN